MLGKSCSLWSDPPSLLKAKDELNETEEKRVAAVKELRGIMKEKAEGGDDLVKAVHEAFGEKPDAMLVRFIRARKYDVNRAYELMKGASLNEKEKTYLLSFGLF